MALHSGECRRIAGETMKAHRSTVVRPPPSQLRDHNTLRTLALLRGVRAGVSVGAIKTPTVTSFVTVGG